jgi:hypothetical protein
MNHRLAAALMMAALVIGACATPYQRHGLTGGFSEYPLDDDTYVVTFKGNGFTSRDRVRMYLHHRCAELTLETGHDAFAVIDGQSVDRTAQWVNPGHATTTTTGSVTSYGNTAYGSAQSQTTYSPPTSTTIVKPGHSVTIRMFNGAKPDGAFDARSVLRLLAPRVQPEETPAAASPPHEH